MSKKLEGSILIFCGAFSFGILATIVKSAFAKGFNSGELMGCQDLFGLIILWAAYFINRYIQKRKMKLNQQTHKEKSTKSPHNKKTTWWQFCIAGLFIGLSEIFYYLSLKELPVSIAIILLMQYVWISLLFDSVYTRKIPRFIQIISVIIVLFGTCLAGGLFNHSATFSWKGTTFALIASISYSLFLMVSGRIGTEMPTLKKSALLITGSCIVVFIAFPPTFLFNGQLATLYTWGLVLSIFAAVLPSVLFSEGMPKTGVAIGSIISAAELPIATLSSHFILKEWMDIFQWIGVIAILVAIILPNLQIIFNKKDIRPQ